jgi:uncharacterized membrane protein
MERTTPLEKSKTGRDKAAWGEPAHAESRWPVELAILAALILYVTLPSRLTLGPVWFVPAVELAILIPLILTMPRHAAAADIPKWRRPVAMGLIAIINVANIISLGLLIHELLKGGSKTVGTELLLGATQIWITNIIVFALWYWELDRGGPEERLMRAHGPPDFLFPQMVTPASAPDGWYPAFVDYLFVSFTNATAFSPTDTMPLTRWAKMLFLIQAATSLLTVAIVAARAVNILS